MKKSLFILGAIVTSSTALFAKQIDFDTPVKWNSGVIASALTNAGFVDSSNANYDVKITRQRILADLLEREAFSLRTATTVCMDKCNMSDFLKNGQGQSRKKCPELCTSFVSNIIKVNNNSSYNIPSAGSKSSDFKSLQGEPADVCRKLAADAVKSGISFPMLCGGHCKRFGNDTLMVTNLEKTKEYIVDDFCNNVEKNKDYFYVLPNYADLQDVSSLTEKDRVSELRKVQTKPASDYIADKERQRQEPMRKQYSDEVEDIGYCRRVRLNLRGDCRRQARKFAQQCRCKLNGYTELSSWDKSGKKFVSACFAGEYLETDSDDRSFSYTSYEYTPTFDDCKATFNENTCGRSITNLWPASGDYYTIDGDDTPVDASSFNCQDRYSDY